ncbi:MAG: cupin domain-containing protein [Bacteroidetes bacterium]|nr:cupin domain-containing protein [Bacteroidota bacterium]
MTPNAFTPASVFSPAASICYSDHAVVSKIVMKKPNGQVTLFAFDAGEELSEHTTPFDAMVQVVDGTAEIVIAGTPHTVPAGSAIIMPGGVPHAVKAPVPFMMLLTMLK